MIIPDKTIREYRASRWGVDTSLLCHAPTVNLNFEQNGNVRVCCYNTSHVLGKWPENTIREIWEGVKLAELRGFVRANDLGGGCIECGKTLGFGNFHGLKAKYYDEFAKDSINNRLKKTWNELTGAPVFPKVMEFELSNRCNLECIMCNGYFSSSIRKNREKLPPLHSPYDSRFVEELTEFIPHLTDARFLGGEPFMIDIYLEIMEQIRVLNPSIRIHITTNGTLLTDRIKDLLEGLNAGIIISMDSVNRVTYERIRVNANFDRVMENLNYLQDYTRRKKTFISMSVCPITENWQELPEILRFCLDREISLFFNLVFYPTELSLKELPPEQLREIISHMRTVAIPDTSGRIRTVNDSTYKVYHDFILQLEGWMTEKIETDRQRMLDEIARQPPPFVRKSDTAWSISKIRSAINDRLTANDDHAAAHRLANLVLDTPYDHLQEVFLLYLQLLDASEESGDRPTSLPKTHHLAELINTHPSRERILMDIGMADPMSLAESLEKTALDEMVAGMEMRYGLMK